MIRIAVAALLLVAASSAGRAQDTTSATAAPAPAETDRITLKDGRVLEGRIQAEDDTAYALRVGGALRLVEKSAVAGVLRGAAPPSADGPPGGDGAPPAGEAAGDRRADRKAARRAARKEGDGAAEGMDSGGGGDAMDPPPPAMEGPPDREGRRRRPPADGEGATATPEVRQWVADCVHALGSGDPLVRRSAAAALATVGPAALAELRRLRDGADPYLRADLDRIVALLERAPADSGDAAAERLRPVLDRVRRDLGLDEAGMRPVARLLAKYAAEGRELVADARDGVMSADDARARVADLRAALRVDLTPHLTADQMARLDALLDEYARRMAGGGGAPPGTPPPAPAPRPPAKGE